jgi:peptidoglycan hydrolase CwlO-like protein
MGMSEEVKETHMERWLREDRERIWLALDATRRKWLADVEKLEAKIEEQHRHIIRLNDEQDPLTMKIERLEEQIARLKKKQAAA